MAHANARLGPAGRRELVRLIVVSRCQNDERLSAVGLARTAHRWKRRWLQASETIGDQGVGERSLEPAASLAGDDRRSRSPSGCWRRASARAGGRG